MSVAKIGLALGSGSARGWAHIGILRALAEHGIRPDVVAGASVGALVAAAYASDQLDVLETWVRKLTRIDVWRLLDTTFRGGGVMRGNRLMRAIGEQIDDRRIEDLPIAFAAVAADLDTGQEIWMRDGSMLSAVRASSGLPGLFTPMWYQGRWLIDGGVVNPVPVSLCRALGADYVIAVNLNSHLAKHPGLRRRKGVGRQPEPTEDTPAAADSRSGAAGYGIERWSELVDGLLDSLKSSSQGPPGILDVMLTSINMMQDRITRSRMVGDPPTLILGPDLGHFQLMDFHRAGEAIAVGSGAVHKRSEELRELQRLMH